MAALDRTTYEGKYNNSSTGLFKENSTHLIGADDVQAFVTDTKESFVNWIDQVKDEDDMASDSAVHLATQQSIKKYVDDQIGGSGTSIPYGITSGTNNYTVAATPAVTAYADGDLFLVEIATTSTGAVTLNFDSVGSKKAYATPESQIGSGYWEAGRYYLLTYDGTLDGSVGGFLQVNESVHGRIYLSGTTFNASSGAVPSGIGTGPSGAIKHGDAFRVGTGGTVGGVVLTAGDLIIAQSDAPIAISGYTVLYGPTAMALKAPLASPTFTGTVTVPNQSAGDNSTKAANTAYVDAALGTVNGSTTNKGVFEAPTLAQIVACTDTGETGALLAVQPSHLGQTFSEDGSGTLATVQAHHNGLIKFSSATPINYVLDALLEDTKITCINYGAGAVTFTNGAGVTLTGNAVLPAAVSTDYPGCMIIYDSLNSPRIVTSSAIGIQDKWVGAEDMMPMITGGCSALTQIEIATSNLNLKVLDFDDTTEESAQFSFVLPRKYAFSFTYKVYWTAAAGTATQTVRWGISTISYSNDDPLTGAFGSTTAVDDALIALNDLHISDVSANIAISGTPVSQDLLGFTIRRIPSADNKTGDARLIGVMLRINTIAAIDG